MKKCKQCGEIKPIENFRNYYGGRTGTYSICKACESINSRAKYLRRKGASLTELDKEELDKIHALYEAQRACGLKPPQARGNTSTSVAKSLDDLISTYTTRAADAIPAELAAWLDKPLTEEPDYYYDVVYEGLLKRYRPVLKVDADTLEPVYDDTHRDALNKVLARFDEYEERYYNKEEH